MILTRRHCISSGYCHVVIVIVVAVLVVIVVVVVIVMVNVMAIAVTCINSFQKANHFCRLSLVSLL